MRLFGTPGGTRTSDLLVRNQTRYPLRYGRPCLVPKARFELARPNGHYALNVARLPFRHFGSANL